MIKEGLVIRSARLPPEQSWQSKTMPISQHTPDQTRLRNSKTFYKQPNPRSTHHIHPYKMKLYNEELMGRIKRQGQKSRLKIDNVPELIVTQNGGVHKENENPKVLRGSLGLFVPMMKTKKGKEFIGRRSEHVRRRTTKHLLQTRQLTLKEEVKCESSTMSNTNVFQEIFKNRMRMIEKARRPVSQQASLLHRLTRMCYSPSAVLLLCPKKPQ